MRCEFINHYESAGAPIYMETFTLTFSGHIPSGSKTSKADIKHEIRRRFSWQLWKKWTTTRALNEFLQMSPPVVEHHAGQFCILPPDEPNPFFSVSKCGLTIYPLVTAHNALTVELDIWMSVSEP